MKASNLALCLALLCAIFLLTGCECTPESDAELCGERNCGIAFLTDSCGDEREVDCGGECDEEGADCVDNICLCETDAQLCDQQGYECGTHELTDSCAGTREVDCGGCGADFESCSQGICECEGQAAITLCEENDLECGGATVVDRCDEERQIGCGGCNAPDDCIDNICICEAGESDAELCDAAGLDCGQATLVDSCMEPRNVDCGGCPAAHDCSDNLCECVGESDAELCEANAGACGTSELTDACGDTRTVECDPCIEGQATLGAVTDASTGSLITDASIKVYTWPPPGGEHYSWFWPTGYRSGDPDFSTTTTAGAGSPVNYEFGTDDPLCLGSQASADLQERQWYRIVIDHPDYMPGIFYREHGDFTTDDCPSACPISSASECFRQDFELIPSSGTHDLPPNLVVDERDLESNAWQCTLLPSSHSYDRLIGFRVRLGASNIGPGPFHLEGQGANVVQHIHRSDGSTTTHILPDGAFEYYDPHHHIHFMDWFRMSLVEPTDACFDVNDRSSSCIVHEGVKLSFCLHDGEPFDGDVMAAYDGESAEFLDPPVCDTTEQGLTSGWKDTYPQGLPGQVIIIGTPSEASGLGSMWIEAEVDPAGALIETEKEGNVARYLIEGPADASDLCSDSSTTLDCRPPRPTWDVQQRRQCDDYLDYDG